MFLRTEDYPFDFDEYNPRKGMKNEENQPFDSQNHFTHEWWA